MLSFRLFCRIRNVKKPFYRDFTSSCKHNNKGIVVGAYHSAKGENIDLTPSGQKFNKQLDDKLLKTLNSCNLKLKKGQCHVLHGLDAQYTSIAVVGLGDRDAGFCQKENRDERRENVRTAAAAGVRSLREIVTEIHVDGCGDPEAAGEGATLILHVYDELKDKEKRKSPVSVSCYVHDDATSSSEESFRSGCSLGHGQNVARRLMEMPANHLTPTIFSEQAQTLLGSSDLCKVVVRDRSWMEEKKMGAFLSVTSGSAQPPKFLEIDYKYKSDHRPFALVGKGITFDTGGISIKPSASMDKMRGDMGGAACVLASVYTLSQLRMPGHVKAFIPLCENMPSGTATKPGDVVTAMNGKTIQVDNTDAEGRLILADALCYAASFNPTGILDMATLTGAIDVALGSGAAGVYTSNDQMWTQLYKAGSRSGDRLWRMPLWTHYTKQVTESALADVNNIGKHARSGGSCTAAAFLKEFCGHDHWIHIDIAGVMENKDEVPYLGKGMSGRPTRTVVEFLKNLSISES